MNVVDLSSGVLLRLPDAGNRSVPQRRPLRHRLRHLQRIQLPGQQRGVAMLVILVLIVAGSLGGMLMMRSSIIDEKMTTNFTTKSMTFHAAEAITEQALTDDNNLSDVLDSTDPAAGIDVGSSWPNTAITVEGRVKQAGTGLARGFSVGSGGYQVYRFRARGTAELTGTRATTVIQQGADRIAPAP